MPRDINLFQRRIRTLAYVANGQGIPDYDPPADEAKAALVRYFGEPRARRLCEYARMTGRELERAADRADRYFNKAAETALEGWPLSRSLHERPRSEGERAASQRLEDIELFL